LELEKGFQVSGPMEDPDEQDIVVFDTIEDEVFGKP
jgi:hypothetical protein